MGTVSPTVTDVSRAVVELQAAESITERVDAVARVVRNLGWQLAFHPGVAESVTASEVRAALMAHGAGAGTVATYAARIAKLIRDGAR